MDVSLQKWNAGLEEEVLPWDFVSRAAFQLGAANPRHKITSGINEGLSDVVRDFMDMINRLGFHLITILPHMQFSFFPLRNASCQCYAMVIILGKY